jgi:hypothetical protein
VSAADAAATYVYGVVRAATAPRLPRARGLPHTGALRALDAGGGLWLVVADAPLARYGAAAIGPRLRDLAWVSRCAVAHAAVVERLARAHPVLPAKLFTLFTGDARAVGDLARRRRAVERLVRRVAGRQEWSVRLGLDARAAARARRGTPARGAPASGTAFLLAKKRAVDAAREALGAAAGEAARVHADLGRHADAARRHPPASADGGFRLVLDATYLVPARRARAFRAAVAACARRLAPAGYRLAATGPWPPYTFAADER